MTYTYDKNGNRITQLRQNSAASNLATAVAATNIAYDAANELIRWNSLTTNLSYDNNGNLATDTQGGVTTTYTWDARNRLTGISRTGLTASFVYDGLGRRKSKTINGTTTGFWFDGDDVYAELTGATPSATYIRGLGIDEPYIRKGTSDEFYETDALGTSVVLTNAAGASQTTYTYEPFGNTIQAGSVSGNAFQYTGRENDGTGLYYYRARYYYPKFQRFVGEDPIGFHGESVNLYAYVANNPMNFKDPLGLEKCPSFGPVFRASLNTTNHFFFSYPTSLTRTAIGLITSGEVARSAGTVSLFPAIRSLPSGGIATLGGIGGTLGSAALNSLLNAAAVGASLEIGIIAGSTINAGIQTIGCTTGLATFF